jgi:hypothetical protein
VSTVIQGVNCQYGGVERWVNVAAAVLLQQLQLAKRQYTVDDSTIGLQQQPEWLQLITTELSRPSFAMPKALFSFTGVKFGVSYRMFHGMSEGVFEY